MHDLKWYMTKTIGAVHVLFLGVAVLIGGMGCSEQATQPLRLGTNLWPGYEPLYLAEHQRQWGRDEVRLVSLPSASEVLRSFRNKSLEAAALTLDEALVLLDSGVPVQVILVLDVSDGGDVILARPEISDFSALKGKKIGVEAGALGAYVLSRALELNDMQLSDVQIERLEVNAHENAYLSGHIDAAVTFEPVRTRLLSAGAHEVFSSREIPGEIVDVLVVHEEVLSQQQENIRKLVEGWFYALDFKQKEPQQAAEIIGQRLKISTQEVIASYEGLRLPDRNENGRMLLGPNAKLLPAVQRLHATMLQQKLLAEKVATDNLLNAKFVE
jgi:NitT/TauT family transport system substrate-binding protein